MVALNRPITHITCSCKLAELADGSLKCSINHKSNYRHNYFMINDLVWPCHLKLAKSSVPVLKLFMMLSAENRMRVECNLFIQHLIQHPQKCTVLVQRQIMEPKTLSSWESVL